LFRAPSDLDFLVMSTDKELCSIYTRQNDTSPSANNQRILGIVTSSSSYQGIRKFEVLVLSKQWKKLCTSPITNTTGNGRTTR
jgi:hypothetical protein